MAVTPFRIEVSDAELDDLHAAIAELPDDVRETYRLFALERKPYAEIAKRLDIAGATVGTRIHRARRHLRDLLARKVGAR